MATTSDTACTVMPASGASTTITVPAGQTSASKAGYSNGMYTVSVPSITIGGNNYTPPSSNSVTINNADQTSAFTYTLTVSIADYVIDVNIVCIRYTIHICFVSREQIDLYVHVTKFTNINGYLIEYDTSYLCFRLIPLLAQ